MPDVRIVHRTQYAYRSPVQVLPHRLMMRPQDSHDLRLHSATLEVEPAPQTTRWAHDVFGNSICLLEWDEQMRTDHLSIVSRLELTHYPAGPGLPRATLDPAAENFPFSYAADEIPDLARLAERQVADAGRRVDAWVQQFLRPAGQLRTIDLLEQMTRAVKAEFTYCARAMEGTQAPVETLERGSGTCRDFALLMMEAVRSLGLAARFVTGYLYDTGTQQATGGGATHAWCSVYLPGAGWVEYDPTNGLVAGTNLIRVGSTRTPEQAAPVSGGFVGDPSDPLPLLVDVTSEVLPPNMANSSSG